MLALLPLLFNVQLSLAEEIPHTLTNDEWSVLFSIMDSVKNKSDNTVWEDFQGVEYGGKEYEGFKDEAKHQALIDTFKHWLLNELTPYYPANLDEKEILVNKKSHLNNIHDNKVFESFYIPNCREKGFECLFVNLSLTSEQSKDRSFPGYLITFHKNKIIDAKVIIWGAVRNYAYKSWIKRQEKSVYRRTQIDHTWTSVQVGISGLTSPPDTDRKFDIDSAAKGRIYFPVMSDHDGWNNNLYSYEHAQWYFVMQSDGKIERLSDFSCYGIYPSEYIKEVGEYMIPECKSFIRGYTPH